MAYQRSNKSGAAKNDILPKIDWAKQKAKQAQLKRGSLFRMDSDELEVRVVPFVHDGRAEIFVATATHFNPTPDVKAVNCPGAGCPICKAIETLPKKQQEDLRATKRCRIAIVDINADEPKVEVWPAPISVVDEIIELASDEKRNPDLLDLDKGKTFIIKRIGSSRNTKYKVQIGQRFSLKGKIKVSDIPDLYADVREESPEVLEEIAAQIAG